MPVETEEQFDENAPQRVTNAVLWTRLRALEGKVDKLPTQSDVRVLLLLAVVANQLIPVLKLGQSPVQGTIAWLMGLLG